MKTKNIQHKSYISETTHQANAYLVVLSLFLKRVT